MGSSSKIFLKESMKERKYKDLSRNILNCCGQELHGGKPLQSCLQEKHFQFRSCWQCINSTYLEHKVYKLIICSICVWGAFFKFIYFKKYNYINIVFILLDI